MPSPTRLPEVALVSALLCLCGITTSFGGQTSTGRLKMALLGQSLIRYNLARESPESASRMTGLLEGHDVVITNFEAVVDEGKASPTHTGLVHRALPEALGSLRHLGVNLLALSSNHSWDLGEGGIRATIAYARRLGFTVAGTGTNVQEAAAPGYLETRAGRVALIALASGSLEKVGRGGVRQSAGATATKPGVLELRLDHQTHVPNAADRNRILAAVREASRRARYVVVYHHNHYDEPKPEDTGAWKQEWARDCIDAGAAVYLSHGTTWIRGIEIYRGRPILHGLTSFIFQVRRPVHYATFDKGAPHPDAWTSAVASLEFDGDRLLSLTLTPLVLHETTQGDDVFYPYGAPRPASGAAAASILGRFAERSRAFGTELQLAGDMARVVLRRH